MQSEAFSKFESDDVYFDLSSFSENPKFDDWQLKISDDVEQNIQFRFIYFADDNMPKHKETHVYEILADGEKIGECFGRRSGKYVITTALKTMNDPGLPAFFYYTNTPFRTEKEAFMRSTSLKSLHCEREHQWDDGVDEAWYPTFDSLYELLEHHRDEQPEYTNTEKIKVTIELSPIELAWILCEGKGVLSDWNKDDILDLVNAIRVGMRDIPDAYKARIAHVASSYYTRYNTDYTVDDIRNLEELPDLF